MITPKIPECDNPICSQCGKHKEFDWDYGCWLCPDCDKDAKEFLMPPEVAWSLDEEGEW